MSFNSLGLSWSLLDALDKNNLKEAYPIQTQAIPAILKSLGLFLPAFLAGSNDRNPD